MNIEAQKKIRVLTQIADLQMRLKNELLGRHGGRELLEKTLIESRGMTFEEFNGLIDLLEEANPGSYCKARRDIFFEYLHTFSAKWFRVAVRYYLGYVREAPLVAHFYDYLIFMMWVPDLDISDDSKMLRDLNYAFWSSRRWEAMKAMHAGDQ